MEWVESNPDVELILAARLHKVLVATDTSSFQRLGGQLFILVGHQVDTEWEVIHTGLLPPQVENTDLGVRDTPTEP